MTLQRSGFQTFVNTYMAPAVRGQFASQNPRAVALAGPGAFKASGTYPPAVGNFAWGVPATSLAEGTDTFAASVLGFVADELQTVITDFLGQDRLTIQAGFPVTLYTHGDFWALVAGGAVAVNATIYANPEDGSPTVDATHFAATGVVATNVLTISAVTKGRLLVGDHLIGTGIDTTIVAQLTGTTGGAGTYTVVNADAGSTAVTAASIDSGYKAQSALAADATSSSSSLAATGILTVGGSITGSIVVGDSHSTVVNGTGVPTNLFIQAQLSGTPGGAGTYQTNSIGVTVGAVAMTFTSGKLVMISRTF